MFAAFEDKVCGVIVKLCGLIRHESEPDEDVLVGSLRPGEHNGMIQNYAAVVGQREDISVEVYQHLYTEKMMEKLPPYYNRDGIKKFEGEKDIYVVFTNKDGINLIYVVSHRFHPCGAMNWEAGSYPKHILPAPIKEQPNESQAPKPLTQHPVIPAEIKARVAKPSSGDGHNPVEEFDEATKQAIAESQLGGTTRPRGSHRPRPENHSRTN